MEEITIEKLKKIKQVVENIRWGVTPRISLNSRSASGEVVDLTYGFMLYVDLFEERPALVIMELKPIISKTVGYVFDVPEDLLKESMQCATSECIGGMYPLSEKLEGWLKKEFGIS
ncbi:MAG: hypothetical protein C4560_04285 [Nitrospiraceae bacterium]|nr:MAG: hypothetical protein C4560_04285 [Nitrospiraceae bacterium]